MKKKKGNVRSSSVVRANKRGGSRLPGAAQRGRSRQRGATLTARVAEAKKELGKAYLAKLAADLDLTVAKQIYDDVHREYKASRRPFGANGGGERRRE